MYAIFACIWVIPDHVWADVGRDVSCAKLGPEEFLHNHVPSVELHQ